MPKPSPELLDLGAYPFRTSIGTRFSDLDPNNHVNNVAMAGVFETARVEFMDSIDARALRGGAARLVSVALDYLSEAFFPGELEMGVGVMDVGRTSWTIATLALQGGRPCVFGRATLTQVRDGRPTPLGDAWRLRLESVRLVAS